MTRRVLAFLCGLTVFAGCADAPPHPAPLIERTALVGNGGIQFARISPDGQWVSWLAPYQGTMNLWVAPVSAPHQARRLTGETTETVSRPVWSPDGTSLLYSQDNGGDQQFVIYSVPPAGGPARALTPTRDTRALIVAISPLVKDRILVGLRSRNSPWQDLYSLNLTSGELRLLLHNDGYSRFIADPHLVVRAALKARSDGGSDVHAVEGDRISASPFESIPYDDVRTTTVLGYSADARTLYWLDSRGRDTAALVAQDVRTAEKKVLGAHAGADVVAATADPLTGHIDAYEVNPLRSEWTGLTAERRQDFERLAKRLDGDIEINSRSNADDKWVVLLKDANRPSVPYLYDRTSGKIFALTDGGAESGNAAVGTRHAVSLRSRDGLTLAAYLTLPAGSDHDGDGRPDVPLPLVLFVHGGPWQRADSGYDATAEFLANRGYAVLAPNFRASTGFGKAFVAAGDGEWGRKMQDDLLDAVDWAVSRGIAVRDKVAIYGGSYGGYAVLAALAFTPEAFACGVDLFGPTNLLTQVESDAARNEFRRAEYYRRMGDPTTEDGRALLAERSPALHANAITRPLLVAQGTNDHK